MWGNCQSYPELYTGYIWFKKGNKQDYSDSVAVPKLRQQVVSVGQLSTWTCHGGGSEMDFLSVVISKKTLVPGVHSRRTGTASYPHVWSPFDSLPRRRLQLAIWLNLWNHHIPGNVDFCLRHPFSSPINHCSWVQTSHVSLSSDVLWDVRRETLIFTPSLITRACSQSRGPINLLTFTYV